MPSAAEFRIRSAAFAELPLLAPLEKRAGELFRESVHAYAADLHEFDLRQLAELQRAGTVWVAVNGTDEPIGFAIVGYMSGAPYLHELDVEPRYGRRGIGRALIRHVAAWAAEQGATTLMLSTFRDVPWNAPFYARLGFEILPLEVYDSEMLAQRQLDAASMLVESRVMMRARLSALLS